MIYVTFHKLLFFWFLVLLIDIPNLIMNSTSSFVSGKRFQWQISSVLRQQFSFIKFVVITSQTSDTFQWKASWSNHFFVFSLAWMEHVGEIKYIFHKITFFLFSSCNSSMSFSQWCTGYTAWLVVMQWKAL